MRVALAIAALIAAPLTAAADEPAPSAPSAPPPTAGLPGMPTPTPTPAPTGGAPGDTPSTTAPAPAPAPAPAGDAPDPAYDTRNFPAPKGADVVIVSYGERSRKNVLMLGGIAAAGVVFGAVGLYFHLDSRSASNEVSSNKPTGEPWTPERADTYDRVHSSSVAAGVFYGIGGALLLTSAVMYIVTEPKEEKTVIHPHYDPKPTALVAPTRGGAMIGGAWRF
ncbi:MAG TPA: hypothetical protein VFV99_06570 [Kofleriaceae bacterium]|nr:hypothetical protein [Kofleriaceae bacterium]